MPAYSNPCFIHDTGCVEQLAFTRFLEKLKGGFIAITPTAEAEITTLVRQICENGYQNGQLWRKWRLQNLGLWVEPGA